MKFENKILEQRKLLNMTQEQLGQQVCVTRQTISNWELSEASPIQNN